MKLLKFVFLSLTCGAAVGQEAGKVTDVELGLAGLQEAIADPELLAQLMEDMKDPEIMAEAKKMMDSPEFKAQMADFQKSANFKEGSEKVKEIMDDPNQSAKLQAQMEHKLKVGQEGLQKKKEATVEAMHEAMRMLDDENVYKDAMKQLKDPEFLKQLKATVQDPSFEPYLRAMSEMFKEPGMEEKFNELNYKFNMDRRAEL